MKNVLCIDDSPTIANILENIIKKNFSNVGVTKILDSTLVIAEINRNYYDLILTDINMPKLNGYELVKEIRADPTNKNVKIIAISSEGGKSSIVKMLKAGADSFIIKPFREVEVVEKIHAVLYEGTSVETRPEEIMLNFIKKMKKEFIEEKETRGHIDMYSKNLISEFAKKIENKMHIDEKLSKLWK